MASYVDKVLIRGESVLHRGQLLLWPHAWKIALGVVLAPVGLGLLLLAWVYILYKTTEIAITNKRVISKSGFITRNTIEINLPKIESVQVDQNLPGRLFDYGTIIIAGAGTPNLSVPGVARPLTFRVRFMEATDTPATPAAGGSQNPSVA
jgi:uncharacterized membrane protein YdbT with pleckstrin-like domain